MDTSLVQNEVDALLGPFDQFGREFDVKFVFHLSPVNRELLGEKSCFSTPFTTSESLDTNEVKPIKRVEMIKTPIRESLKIDNKVTG